MSTDGDANSAGPVREAPSHPGARSEPARYEIRLWDHVDVAWSEHFEGMSISHEGDDVTVITGVIADQAALHGLLARIRDLGLPLLSLRRLEDRDLPER